VTTPQEFVETALATSSADGCVVLVEEHSETNLRWATNSLTTNGQMRSRTVTVISLFDKSGGTSAGVVSRSITNEDELASLVRASEQAGRDADPADDAAPLVENYAHADDWNADPATTDVAVLQDFAAGLGAEFRSWQARDQLLFGFAEHHLTSTFLGTSTGLRRRFDQPDGRIEINGKSRDYARSAYVGRHTNDFGDIDIAAVAAELDQRLGWAAKRIDLDAGRYETILPPMAVADLMVYAYWTASARDADEGRNVYAGKLGSRLSQLPVRLFSDPAYPELGCSPFVTAVSNFGGMTSIFDNGQQVAPVDWIRDGVLTDLARPRAWAAKTGAQPRPLVENLVLDAGGTASVDELVARTERGLLLTCLWYIREVDPQTLLLTGLTRDGVYLVEDGSVRGAVTNFRFNESPIDLLGRATEAGRTEHAMSREWGDYFRRSAMPALRIPDFNMSTVSQAS